MRKARKLERSSEIKSDKLPKILKKLDRNIIKNHTRYWEWVAENEKEINEILHEARMLLDSWEDLDWPFLELEEQLKKYKDNFAKALFLLRLKKGAEERRFINLRLSGADETRIWQIIFIFYPFKKFVEKHGKGITTEGEGRFLEKYKEKLTERAKESFSDALESGKAHYYPWFYLPREKGRTRLTSGKETISRTTANELRKVGEWLKDFFSLEEDLFDKEKQARSALGTMFLELRNDLLNASGLIGVRDIKEEERRALRKNLKNIKKNYCRKLGELLSYNEFINWKEIEEENLYTSGRALSEKKIIKGLVKLITVASTEFDPFSEDFTIMDKAQELISILEGKVGGEIEFEQLDEDELPGLGRPNKRMLCDILEKTKNNLFKDETTEELSEAISNLVERIRDELGDKDEIYEIADKMGQLDFEGEFRLPQGDMIDQFGSIYKGEGDNENIKKMYKHIYSGNIFNFWRFIKTTFEDVLEEGEWEEVRDRLREMMMEYRHLKSNRDFWEVFVKGDSPPYWDNVRRILPCETGSRAGRSLKRVFADSPISVSRWGKLGNIQFSPRKMVKDEFENKLNELKDFLHEVIEEGNPNNYQLKSSPGHPARKWEDINEKATPEKGKSEIIAGVAATMKENWNLNEKSDYPKISIYEGEAGAPSRAIGEEDILIPPLFILRAGFGTVILLATFAPILREAEHPGQ